MFAWLKKLDEFLGRPFVRRALCWRLRLKRYLLASDGRVRWSGGWSADRQAGAAGNLGGGVSRDGPDRHAVTGRGCQRRRNGRG